MLTFVSRTPLDVSFVLWLCRVGQEAMSTPRVKMKDNCLMPGTWKQSRAKVRIARVPIFKICGDVCDYQCCFICLLHIYIVSCGSRFSRYLSYIVQNDHTWMTCSSTCSDAMQFSQQVCEPVSHVRKQHSSKGYCHHQSSQKQGDTSDAFCQLGTTKRKFNPVESCEWMPLASKSCASDDMTSLGHTVCNLIMIWLYWRMGQL